MNSRTISTLRIHVRNGAETEMSLSVKLFFFLYYSIQEYLNGKSDRSNKFEKSIEVQKFPLVFGEYLP